MIHELDEINSSDLWNSMVVIISKHHDEAIVEKAKMLLRQYNTAGGRMIQHELESFIQEIKTNQ